MRVSGLIARAVDGFTFQKRWPKRPAAPRRNHSNTAQTSAKHPPNTPCQQSRLGAQVRQSANMLTSPAFSAGRGRLRIPQSSEVPSSTATNGMRLNPKIPKSAYFLVIPAGIDAYSNPGAPGTPSVTATHAPPREASEGNSHSFTRSFGAVCLWGICTEKPRKEMTTYLRVLPELCVYGEPLVLQSLFGVACNL